MRVDKIMAAMPVRVSFADSSAQKSTAVNNSVKELPAYRAFLGSPDKSSSADRAKLAVYDSIKASDELNKVNERIETVDAIARINIDSAFNKIEKIKNGTFADLQDDYSDIRVKLTKDNNGKLSAVREYKNGTVLREIQIFDDETIKILNRRDKTVVFADKKAEPLKWIKYSNVAPDGEMFNAAESITYFDGKIKRYIKTGEDTTVVNFFSDYKKDTLVMLKNVKGSSYFVPEQCDYICSAIRPKADEDGPFYIKSFLDKVSAQNNSAIEAQRALFYDSRGLNPGVQDFTCELVFEEPVSYHENMLFVPDEQCNPQQDVKYGLSMKNTAKNGFVEI